MDPIPGYSAAAFMLRIFGDGLIHGSVVSSNHSSRRQFLIATTVRSAPMWFSALNSLASSPSVRP